MVSAMEPERQSSGCCVGILWSGYGSYVGTRGGSIARCCVGASAPA
jgi:hypothetical protein